jgi:MFS transporter, DHA2 family, multidrug resistance protein
MQNPDPATYSHPDVSRHVWFVVFGMTMGAFMGILDIQIANASLRDVMGGLSASVDEGSWITTSYIVAELISIPLTSWLSRVVTLRYYLLFNCIAFMFFSVLCGLATSLPEMIVFRATQGWCGGALIPSAMSIIRQKLPPAKQAVGMALYGITATLAPSIGPALGGWLTETYSWHWIFFINIVPGILLFCAVWTGLDREPMRLDELGKGDWLGILLMAAGIGCFSVVLEEGERRDWFTTDWIRHCSLIAAFCLPLFVIHELFRPAPFINLRMLGNPVIARTSVLALVLGLALYGSVYALPVYLSTVQQYNPADIGLVMLWSGAPQLLITPVIPALMRTVGSNLLIISGFALFSVSCLLNGYISPDTAGPQLVLPQLVRAAGQPLIVVPLSVLATSSVSYLQVPDASCLFIVFRNLGGTIGVSLLSTFTTFREHYHFQTISDQLTVSSNSVQDWIRNSAEVFVAKGASDDQAISRAQAMLQTIVRHQAYTMAYSDCFFVMGIALFICVILTITFKKGK